MIVCTGRCNVHHDATGFRIATEVRSACEVLGHNTSRQTKVRIIQSRQCLIVAIDLNDSSQWGKHFFAVDTHVIV